MPGLHLLIPELGSFVLGPERPELTFGRSSGNSVVLTDPSLSRRHARITWRENRALLEDLQSHNGTFVNGRRVQEPVALGPGDQLRLGRVVIEAVAAPALLIREEDSDEDSGSSVFLTLDQLRDFRGPGSDAEEARRLRKALNLIHAFSLELMREGPLNELLSRLLTKLAHLMKPDRAAILLREDGGELAQALAYSARESLQGPLTLSRAMVAAAVERKEAMLVQDPARDARISPTDSVIQSGVTSLMTVPMEHEGQVVGLLYLDTCRPQARFTPEDLQVVASLGHLAAARFQQARAAEALRRARILEHDLELARQIQTRLLPAEPPALAGFELFGSNRACHQVSGDLFGYFPRQDGRLWVVLADVSGKGLGAGLVGASFQAYLWAWAEDTDDPAVLAARLSAELARRVSTKRYLTAFLALLDPATGRVRCTSAGHNPVALLRADGRRESLESMGFPLALFPGTPYGLQEVQLAPGDLLALYTDGFSEAASPQDTELGPGGIEAILGNQAPGLPLPELAERLDAAVEAHTEGAALADDRTLILIRRA